jgi:hypothetical protein
MVCLEPGQLAYECHHVGHSFQASHFVRASSLKFAKPGVVPEARRGRPSWPRVLQPETSDIRLLPSFNFHYDLVF